jgi:hypothetical protein
MNVTALRSRTTSLASPCSATVADSRGTVARSNSPLTTTVATPSGIKLAGAPVGLR